MNFDTTHIEYIPKIGDVYIRKDPDMLLGMLQPDGADKYLVKEIFKYSHHNDNTIGYYILDLVGLDGSKATVGLSWLNQFYDKL